MEKMREEFEDWFKCEFGYTPGRSELNIDDYSTTASSTSWLAWKASRAALCVEFTKPREKDSSGLACYDEYWREDVEDMLNSAGVSYK